MMRPSAGLRSLFANASYGVAAKLIAIGLRLVYVLALARLLGAADYGLYVYALSWYVIFMPLTNLGQDLDLGRAVGGRRPDAAQVVAATFTLRVYAAVAVMVGVLAAGWVLNPDERGRLLVTLMALAVLPRALALWTQMVCLAHERSALILRQETAFRLLEATLGIGVLLLGAEVWVVALVHLLSWTLQAASGVRMVRRRLLRFAFRLALPDWRTRIGAGLRVGFSRMLDGWLVSGPVVLYRQLADDLDGLGILALCLQLLNLLRVVPNALSAAALPLLSRALLRADGKEMRFVQALGLLATAQAIAVAWLLAVAGDRLIPLALGSDFAPALGYLNAVCWLAILPALGSGISKLVGLRGGYDRLLAASLCGAGVMSVGAWLATDAFGVGAMLLASALGSLVWVLLLVRPLGRAALSLGGLALGGVLATVAALAWSADAVGLTGLAPVVLCVSAAVIGLLLDYR
jgi:O-antigen/teichoic acid export membrane protein